VNALAVLVAFFAAAQEAPQAAPVRVGRGALAAVEKSIDTRFARAYTPEAFELLGPTRGVYLESYGAVFSTELNLIVTPNVSPFRQSIGKAEIARIHERKVQRVAVLKEQMREILAGAAASLENLPPSEQVVVAVSLFHYSWEDYSGLPSQIVMQAERRKLLANATRETAIRTQEF